MKAEFAINRTLLDNEVINSLRNMLCNWSVAKVRMLQFVEFYCREVITREVHGDVEKSNSRINECQ